MLYEEENTTLNCSSEQIRTLCEVTVVVVVEVGEIVSELIVIGIGTFEVDGVDSIVGILEPCPIDWFEPSNTTILNTGALCFNRISFAKIKEKTSFELKQNIYLTNPLYMYLFDLLQ